MASRRGGGAPLLGKDKQPERDHLERFSPRTARRIGSLNKSSITEDGKTRVNHLNTKLKREMKAWRIRSPFRRWRIANNLTIQEASDVLGVPNITYQQWEYGRYSIRESVTVRGQKHKFNEMCSPICGFTRAIHNSWMRSKPKPELKAKKIRGKDDE